MQRAMIALLALAACSTTQPTGVPSPEPTPPGPASALPSSSLLGPGPMGSPDPFGPDPIDSPDPSRAAQPSSPDPGAPREPRDRWVYSGPKGSVWNSSQAMVGIPGGGFLTAAVSYEFTDEPSEQDIVYDVRAAGSDGHARASFNGGDPLRRRFEVSDGYQSPDISDIKRRDRTDGSFLAVLSVNELDFSTKVVRITGDGRLDRSFEERQGGWTSSGPTYPSKIVVLADGSSRICLDRTDLLALKSNGARDTSMGPEGVRREVAPDLNGCLDLALDGNDRIMMLGAGPAIARLRTNGDLDRSFGVDGVASFERPDRRLRPTVMRLDGNGGAYAAGYAFTDAGSVEWFIAHVNSAGLLAPDLGGTGIQFYPARHGWSGTRPGTVLLERSDEGSLIGGTVVYQGEGITTLSRIDPLTGMADATFAGSGTFEVRRILASALPVGEHTLVTFGHTTPEGSWSKRRVIWERFSL